ncbi:MAG: hypothetical protein JKY13_03250 [Gammaproteobacteria bacterium]|nr:hypothetical protein [Gammaproteobacteria bacterium]
MANQLLSDEVITSFLTTFLKKAIHGDISDINTNTRILDLGITSIEMIDYVRRIQEEFEIMISLQTLVKDGLTLVDLLEHIKERMQAKENVVKEQKHLLLNTKEFPVLDYQLELWYYYNYSDELAASYNSYTVFDITGHVNENLFKESIKMLSAQYDFLRLSFKEAEMIQTVSPDSTVKFETMDVNSNNSDDSNELMSAKGTIQSLVSDKFDIFSGVLNIYLLSNQNNHQALLFFSHEIIFNARNLIDIYNKILDTYNGFFKGQHDEKSKKVISPYADYVNKVIAMKDTIVNSDVKKSLLNYLQGADTNYYSLPTDKLRPGIKQYYGDRLSTKLDANTINALTQWNKEHKCTMFNYLCFAFSMLSSRLSNTDTVTMGSYGDISNLVGHSDFNTQNHIAIHTTLENNKTLLENINIFSKQMAQVFDNQYYPFHNLIKDLNLERDQSRTPLFSVFFQYVELPEINSTSDFESRMTILPVQFAKYDLVVTINKVGGAYLINFDYSTELFSLETVKHWLRLYKHMIEDMLNHADTKLKDYICCTQEQTALLASWSNNNVDVGYQSVVEKTNSAYLANPSAIAIIENSKKSLISN